MSESRSSATHPLDPLTVEELHRAVAVTRAQYSKGGRILFEQVRLVEPEKSVVRSFKSGDDFERIALAVFHDRDSGAVYEALVDLRRAELISLTPIPNAQTCVSAVECEEMSELVKQNSEFLAALHLRGIEDVNQVSVEMLCMANFANDSEQDRRLLRGHCFFIDSPDDNPHVRPIEGLVPIVDLNAMQVLRVEDTGVRPIPSDLGEYRAAELTSVDTPLATLEITQPNGPDFVVTGHHVQWKNWSFRVGFTPREGLVLHTVAFDDGEESRSIVYRASLSELVVPYAETLGDHYLNHSFDLGEGVFGSAVNSLSLGCDCVGEIYYFDVNLTDAHGEVKELRNAICMHEEDYGVLWKHTDATSNNTEVRRSRRLVVSSFFTIGNYDYGLFWYLYLDGTIEFEAKLTGMLYTRAMHDNEELPYGAQVAPNLCGMIHEHYFNVRLDMCIDGDANTVVEVDANRIPQGPDNPHGNAHGIRETEIESESTGARYNCPADGRYWKVINRGKRNRLGWNPGYKLMPGPNVKPMHQADSPFMRRAGFVAHDLWVTAYDPKELHAPGDYLNQSENGPGLPQWSEANRSLIDADVVLWHTVGVMHVPRPEDFPVMPVEYVGFMLKPMGFFERNPALSLAPPGCKA
ncbi:MAG: primary-amine oxidase [Pseudomonadota bacterium]